MLGEKAKDLRLGLSDGERGCPDFTDQPRRLVHADHHRIHRLQRARGRGHHQIGPLLLPLQCTVGDDDGDLDDVVPFGVQPGHLQVHPDQRLLHQRDLRRVTFQERVPRLAR